MKYVGDFAEDATVYLMFNTFDSNDPAASVTITNFTNTDVHIHKDDGLTQRNNAAGITVSIDFDSITGSHMIKIDTSNDAVAGFWVTGSDYFVRIEGTTVDAGTINAVVGHFSIENRFMRGTDAAGVNAEVLDVMETDTFAEPSSVPAATASLKDMLHWLFTLSRNKGTQTSTTKALRNDADNADIGTSAISDDGTTFTRAKWS